MAGLGERIRSEIGVSSSGFDDIIFRFFGDGGFGPGSGPEAEDAVRSVPVRVSRETPYGVTTNESVHRFES
jgi:hypothetical protein